VSNRICLMCWELHKKNVYLNGFWSCLRHFIRVHGWRRI